MSTDETTIDRLLRCLIAGIDCCRSRANGLGRHRPGSLRWQPQADGGQVPTPAEIWDDAQVRACLEAKLTEIRMKDRLASIREAQAQAVELRRLGATEVERGDPAEACGQRRCPR